MASGTRNPTRRDREVRSYVRRELYPHVEGARDRLNAARLGAGGVRTATDLARVSPIAIDEVGDGSRHMLRPTRAELLRSGTPLMRVWTAWASTWGRWSAFMRRLEPAYRPVHFFSDGSVVVGSSTGDLIRLAGFGAQWMRALDLTGDDSVALVSDPSSRVEEWELSGGTRRAGVPLIVCAPVGAAAHRASVVAGRPDAVASALSDGVWAELRLVIVFSGALDVVDEAVRRAGAPDQVSIRRAGAPAGTRSAWFECRGGAERGWHTSQGDLVQVSDDGEALWTGIGWAGTVFMRLRTDALVDHIEDDPCPSCGRPEPRVFLAPGSPTLARWLGEDPRVAEFRLTADGAEVLPVRAGKNVRLLADAGRVRPGCSVEIVPRRQWSS